MFKFITAAALALASSFAFAAVDVNQADQTALDSVKGIGPGLATKMLDERKKSPFKDWSDLIQRVNGVGEGNATRFSTAGLTVNGKAYAAAASRTDTKAAAPVATPVKK